jgi:biopolymer transport protein ExbD
MQAKRTTKLLVDVPSVATGDIAFNLIVFFLVCASVHPDNGRKQTIPASENQQDQQQKASHVEVTITRSTVALNGDVVALAEFVPRLRRLLAEKIRPEDKIVVVKSKPEAPYRHWILVTAMIEEAGGTVTIQREEEREVQVPG